jgi:hypothetical protein
VVGVVKSLGGFACGPVVLVQTQNLRGFFKRKSPLEVASTLSFQVAYRSGSAARRCGLNPADATGASSPMERRTAEMRRATAVHGVIVREDSPLTLSYRRAKREAELISRLRSDSGAHPEFVARALIRNVMSSEREIVDELIESARDCL